MYKFTQKVQIYANDVENGVRRVCNKLSSKEQLVLKMRLMKKKIGDAFKDLEGKKKSNAAVWKASKNYD